MHLSWQKLHAELLQLSLRRRLRPSAACSLLRCPLRPPSEPQEREPLPLHRVFQFMLMYMVPKSPGDGDVVQPCALGRLRRLVRLLSTWRWARGSRCCLACEVCRLLPLARDVVDLHLLAFLLQRLGCLLRLDLRFCQLLLGPRMAVLHQLPLRHQMWRWRRRSLCAKLSSTVVLRT